MNSTDLPKYSNSCHKFASFQDFTQSKWPQMIKNRIIGEHNVKKKSLQYGGHIYFHG